MKYGKRILFLVFAIFLLAGTLVTSASAQTRRVRVVSTYSQPVVARRIYYRRYYDPFWRGTLWGSPFGYDPYDYDPYLRLQRDKYYREKAVRDAKRNIAKNREKYASDGYLTPKEREKMAKDQRKYAKAVASLNKFYRNY